ncbi:hypothetical protein EA473_02830 [Natrarchaeobius chitinivorans]|uniref:Uncharacterized protein n=1 Tax=Natrarchaeobius chitinivorans TaxID=1679083 RepID=A0A3N6NDW0_NATCH|nr:hypothetical protein EA473_02830 [Natrarchaeobius chitinivorans]
MYSKHHNWFPPSHSPPFSLVALAHGSFLAARCSAVLAPCGRRSLFRGSRSFHSLRTAYAPNRALSILEATVDPPKSVREELSEACGPQRYGGQPSRRRPTVLSFR